MKNKNTESFPHTFNDWAKQAEPTRYIEELYGDGINPVLGRLKLEKVRRENRKYLQGKLDASGEVQTYLGIDKAQYEELEAGLARPSKDSYLDAWDGVAIQCAFADAQEKDQGLIVELTATRPHPDPNGALSWHVGADNVRITGIYGLDEASQAELMGKIQVI